LRKLLLNVLRLVDVGKVYGGIAKRRNVIGWDLPQFIDQVMSK